MESSVPVLVGPTASGKTEVSLLAAERLSAEIVSVDSRQLYRGMEIGSAAPSAEDLRRVPHHFILEVEPTYSLSFDGAKMMARSPQAARKDMREQLRGS